MIVGIDLGTTHSLVSVWRDGRAELLPNAHGDTLTPSVVGLGDDGAILVGMAAKQRLSTHPNQTAALFKRHMGTDRKVLLGKRKFLPEELSAMVLRALKADAEAALGVAVDEAIVTVPAYFSDAQRKATQRAGQLAGLRVDRLLNEPTAAALAYGLHDLQQESRFLVFDLGGGTFDISVLEMFDGIMEVRASAGDNFLGGEDFSTAIARWICEQQRWEWERLSLTDAAALQIAAERTKRAITNANSVEFALTLPDRGASASLVLDELTFERIAEPLLTRLSAPIRRALRDARIAPAELDEIVLVGGASRMPVVRKMVARLFGRIPAMHLQPDEVIGLGAGVQAGLKARDAALSEVVLTDVSSFSLGMEVVETVAPGRQLTGRFLPILERNTVIPASRVERVSTTRPNQAAVDIEVFQGESRSTADNIRLGSLKLRLLPSQELQPIDVRFTYDINGLLEVEATIVETGTVERAVIQRGTGGMSDEDLQKRLAELDALKLHPRDEAENAAVLAWGRRLFEERLGDERSYVGMLITRFEGVLEEQDGRKAKIAAAELREALRALDDDGWL